MRLLAPVLGVALLTLPSALIGQADTTAEVEEAIMAWQTAWNAGDGAGVAALYTEDAILLPPGSEPVQGKEAIQTFWQGTIDAFEDDRVELQSKEVHIHGQMAVQIGRWAGLDSDGEQLNHGSFLHVWKKTDQGWKTIRDIWNSSVEQ
jgi:uncharacterized protein (TIGR02246 family)